MIFMIKETEGEQKANTNQTKWKEKKRIKWTSMLVINDISPRKSRDYVYVVLYTDANVTVCCNEFQAQRLCLSEPYEMAGYLNYKKGGVYLVLEKATLFNGGSVGRIGKE